MALPLPESSYLSGLLFLMACGKSDFYIKNETDSITKVHDTGITIAPNQCALVKESDFPVSVTTGLPGCAPSAFILTKGAHYIVNFDYRTNADPYKKVDDDIQGFLLKHCKKNQVSTPSHQSTGTSSCGPIAPPPSK